LEQRALAFPAPEIAVALSIALGAVKMHVSSEEN
jgi:hypothetical protein